MSSAGVALTGQEGPQPPLVVRAGLVGATTALMTPLFPVIGFNQLVFRFVDPVTRTAINGGTSMLYFSCMVLVPKVFFYAPLMLPFALGNGVTSGILYLALEAGAGGPEALAALRVGPFPVAGPLLGLATALLVPFVYPISWSAVYPEVSSMLMEPSTWDFIWSICYENNIVPPCLATTGLAVGAVTHLFLKPVIVGIPGVPWTTSAGGVLAATLVGLGALYSTATRTSVQHLRDVELPESDGSFIGWLLPETTACFCSEEELTWVPGLDARSGKVISCQVLQHRPEVHSESREEQKWEVSSVSRSGLQQVQEARGLLAKGQDRRLRLHRSRRAAFFDGFGHEPMASSDLEAIEQGLPVGEAIVTDATVLLVAGTVPRVAVRDALESLGRHLRTSCLAERLSTINPFRAGWGPFRTNWATRNAAPEAVLGDLEVHAAQLRELLRLEAGWSPGPWSAAELAGRLEEAGLLLPRARGALASLQWRPAEQPSARSADWSLIRGQQRKRRRELVGSALLGGAALGAAAYCYLSGQLK